ncbi:MAG: hypothetical protein ACIWVG_09865, partial [Gloeotrichia echinulata HAB0833]
PQEIYGSHLRQVWGEDCYQRMQVYVKTALSGQAITAVFRYLDHTSISVFLSSFAPLRLLCETLRECVRYKNVVHLPSPQKWCFGCEMKDKVFHLTNLNGSLKGFNK